MIHLAVGLLVLSLTTLGLALASLVLPGAPSVSHTFAVGAVLACAISSVLVFTVWRLRL